MHECIYALWRMLATMVHLTACGRRMQAIRISMKPMHLYLHALRSKLST